MGDSNTTGQKVTMSVNSIPHSHGSNAIITVCKLRIQSHDSRVIGYESTGLTMHPPPPKKRSRVGSFFTHRCLLLPKFFPQRKSEFWRRY